MDIDKKTSQLIAALDKFYEEHKVSVYIPSLKKNVDFSSITGEQQKQLLKSTLDENTQHLNEFKSLKVINQIIRDNQKEFSLKDINTIDRQCIILQLRSSINDDISVKGNTFKVSEYIDNIKSITPDQYKMADSDYFILEIPTVEQDEMVNDLLLKKNLGRNKPKAADILLDLLVFETSKYIKKLTINDFICEDKLEIIKLYDHIPSSIGSKILDSIKQKTSLISTICNFPDDSFNIDSSLLTSA